MLNHRQSLILNNSVNVCLHCLGQLTPSSASLHFFRQLEKQGQSICGVNGARKYTSREVQDKNIGQSQLVTAVQRLC